MLDIKRKFVGLFFELPCL